MTASLTHTGDDACPVSPPHDPCHTGSAALPGYAVKDMTAQTVLTAWRRQVRGTPGAAPAQVDRNLAWVRQVIETVDAHLDAAAPEVFRLGTPASQIANMHRRVDKAAREALEAMEEMSLLTGENPRKGQDPAARGRMLEELGDTAVAALLGIQSQVKDIRLAWAIFIEALAKALSRVPDEARPS